ncbi:MAG: fatty acid desaturase [Planctomycetes bacterium]|nr:fatty acid desaturase [Planctomycetota bacterium]
MNESSARAAGFEYAEEIRRMHAKVKDLYGVRSWIYWMDLALSAGAGWGALYWAMSFDAFATGQVLLVAFAGAALYRALSFTHELAHLRRGALPGFRAGWNLLAGIPLLAPHFTYRGIHNLHHQHHAYATDLDAEYLPLAEGPPARIASLFAVVPLIAVILALRFGVLAPLGALHPALRAWILRRCSTLGMRIGYARALPQGAERAAAAAEEAGCCLFVWCTAALLAAGVLPWRGMCLWWAAWTAIGALNALRGIGATHRYRGTGGRMTLPEQLDDSVNVDSNALLTVVLCPVGLRWHALHHLFPALPYHALGTAHRRIMADLPDGGFYRETLVPSVWAGFAGVWREARANAQAKRAAASASLYKEARDVPAPESSV